MILPLGCESNETRVNRTVNTIDQGVTDARFTMNDRSYDTVSGDAVTEDHNRTCEIWPTPRLGTSTSSQILATSPARCGQDPHTC